MTILGDIHGQIHDLIAHLDGVGWPDAVPASHKYLFLGDYVDRGKYSIETICLLLALAIKHPSQVVIYFQLISKHLTNPFSLPNHM